MNTVFPSPALLLEAENFTLFIKNSISFPRFKVNRFVGKEGRDAGGLTQLQRSQRTVSLPPCCSAHILEVAVLACLLESRLLWRRDTL